ncbi:NAD(P)-binding protein [Aspergillus affinis]|uniref:NAD(P)-binding protein n=1 Tax=Aspergillus affinis TaxID=1070780 RepID=UPI0022FF0CDC|nr:NAD(P)-binding protein [Aspergillus affinis]KAI9036806.1 NAD(P)-binding protein [Aspergillus affinis]
MVLTTVLITGANRGLGNELLQVYLARPNHLVIAANRNPEHPTSKALAELPTGENTQLLVVKLDVSVESDHAEAIAQLAAQGIDHLDLVIANAAVANVYPRVSEITTADLQGHLTPNVFGVVWLYQATRGLLERSSDPKFVSMGSGAGWLENQPPVPNAVYGPSKVAVHWLTKMMNFEEEKINAFIVNPGWCRTEMGNRGALAYGYAEAPLEVGETIPGIVRLIDAATKETHGGKLWSHRGTQEAW